MGERSDFFSTIITEAHERPAAAVYREPVSETSVFSGELTGGSIGDHPGPEHSLTLGKMDGFLQASFTGMVPHKEKSAVTGAPPAKPPGFLRRQSVHAGTAPMNGKHELQSVNADSLSSLNATNVIESGLPKMEQSEKNRVLVDLPPETTTLPKKATRKTPVDEPVAAPIAGRRPTSDSKNPVENVTGNVLRNTDAYGRVAEPVINRQYASPTVKQDTHPKHVAVREQDPPSGKRILLQLPAKEHVEAEVSTTTASPANDRQTDAPVAEYNQTVPARFIEQVPKGNISYVPFMQSPRNDGKKPEVNPQAESSLHIGRIDVIVEPPPARTHAFKAATVSPKSNVSRRYLRRLS